jgi:hypothetical protein
MNTPQEPLFRLTFGLLWLAFLTSRLYFQSQIKGGKEYAVDNAKTDKRYFVLFMLAFILLPVYSLAGWFSFEASRSAADPAKNRK